MDNKSKAKQFVGRAARTLNLSENEATELLAVEPGASYWINRIQPVGPSELIVSSTAIDWLPDAFTLQSDKRELSQSPAFQEGRVYIQNLSSMVAVHALDPQSGESILDVCASPGGKAARAASLTNNSIELWANDSIKPRVEKMRSVFDLFGVKTSNVTQHPGQYLNKYIDETFDKVILDAQCSGEAMMNPERPHTLRYWSEKRIAEMSYLQQKMLVASWKLLKPGGSLVYSTCTYGPEENESPVDFLLQHHKNADIETVNIPLGNTMPGITSWADKNFDKRLVNATRILPSEYTEAFFVCKLRKAS